MRKYGSWAGNPRGVPEDKSRCIVEVPNVSGLSVLFHQCRRRRGYGQGGQFCRQHADKVENGGYVSVPPGGERK